MKFLVVLFLFGYFLIPSVSSLAAEDFKLSLWEYQADLCKINPSVDKLQEFYNCSVEKGVYNNKFADSPKDDMESLAENLEFALARCGKTFGIKPESPLDVCKIVTQKSEAMDYFYCIGHFLVVHTNIRKKYIEAFAKAFNDCYVSTFPIEKYPL